MVLDKESPFYKPLCNIYFLEKNKLKKLCYELQHLTVVWLLGIRLHAQAFTLAALAGAAVIEYYDHKSGAKAERVAKFLNYDGQPHRD